MEYAKDWESSKKRIAAFWERQIIDRCCISVIAPKNGIDYDYEPFPDDQNDKAGYWTDPERVLNRYIRLFESTYYAGEAFPQTFIKLGAGGLAGYFKNVKYQFEESLWFFPSIDDWTNGMPEFDKGSYFYKKTIEFAKFFASQSKDRFFVSMPDIAGNADALAHLRGSENLLMDLKDCPSIIHTALEIMQEAWIETYKDVYDIVYDVNESGSCIAWLRTWAPGKYSQLQCDLSVMISANEFDEFIKPEVIAQTNYLDHSLYHLDGIEQLRHLDTLLSVPKLDVIQWQSVAGQPSYMDFIPELKKIQKSGKGLHLAVKPRDVATILDELSSKGLLLLVNASSKQEADDIVKLVEKNTRE